MVFDRIEVPHVAVPMTGDRAVDANVRSVWFLLGDLDRTVVRFQRALELFDFCEDLTTQAREARNRRRSGVSPTSFEYEQAGDGYRSIRERYSNWQDIAAREGAVVIWDFYRVLTQTWQLAKETEWLRDRMDVPELGHVKDDYESQFPGRRAGRNAASHQVEISSTPTKRAEHAFDGPYSNQAVLFSENCTGSIFSGIVGRKVCQTWRGLVHEYELTSDTLGILRSFQARFYSAFGPVSIRHR